MTEILLEHVILINVTVFAVYLTPTCDVLRLPLLAYRVLEATAHYANFLLVPAESFGLGPRLFLAVRQEFLGLLLRPLIRVSLNKLVNMNIG